MMKANQPICCKCEGYFDSSELYLKSQRKGYCYFICRPCSRFSIRSYRRTPKGKAAHLKRNKSYYQNNKSKVLARVKLQKAIRAGKIKRPLFCNSCKGQGKIEAHHDNYSLPLDVKWLCVNCHSKLTKPKRPLVFTPMKQQRVTRFHALD